MGFSFSIGWSGNADSDYTNNLLMQKENREYEEGQREKWDKINYNRYLENREYNSPANQMNRLKEAGVNLHAASGMLTPVSSSQPTETVPQDAGSIPYSHDNATAMNFPSPLNVKSIQLDNERKEIENQMLREQSNVLPAMLDLKKRKMQGDLDDDEYVRALVRLADGMPYTDENGNTYSTAEWEALARSAEAANKISKSKVQQKTEKDQINLVHESLNNLQDIIKDRRFQRGLSLSKHHLDEKEFELRKKQANAIIDKLKYEKEYILPGLKKINDEILRIKRGEASFIEAKNSFNLYIDKQDWDPDVKLMVKGLFYCLTDLE